MTSLRITLWSLVALGWAVIIGGTLVAAAYARRGIARHRAARRTTSGGRLLVVLSLAAGLLPGCAYIERASAPRSGSGGGGSMGAIDVSGDGRYVVYVSLANDLVEDDTNGAYDVFVRDTMTNANVRVSTAPNGVQGDANSGFVRLEAYHHVTTVAISRSGRYVTFASEASNLVPDDTNRVTDVFLRDRDTDGDGIFDEPGTVTTVRASVSSTGTEGNGPSGAPVVSDDGRHVAFWSAATNLASGDTNLLGDVFAHNVQSGATTRINLSSFQGQDDGGAKRDLEGIAISATGRHVAFSSDASTFTSLAHDRTQVYIRDRDTDRDGIFDEAQSVRTELMSTPTFGVGGGNDLSVNVDLDTSGRYVAFWSRASNLVPNDTNSRSDVFVRDRDPDADGMFDEPSPTVAMEIASLDDLFDRPVGANEFPAISGDGRYVGFVSSAAATGDATNGERQVFVRDRRDRRTTLVSREALGEQGDDLSLDVALNADGRYAVFATLATNLVPGDTNGGTDTFITYTRPPKISDAVLFPVVFPGREHALPRGTTSSILIIGLHLLEAPPQVSVGNDNVAVAVANVGPFFDAAFAELTVPADAPLGPVDVGISVPGTGPGPNAGGMDVCEGCLEIVAG